MRGALVRLITIFKSQAVENSSLLSREEMKFYVCPEDIPKVTLNVEINYMHA